MAPLAGRGTVAESLKTILICIDTYEELYYRGTLYHGSFKDAKPFSNLMQLILIIETILDDTGFPKETTEKRRFNTFTRPDRNTELLINELDFDAKKGSLATFRLKVMFRHNASWQGSLAWMEGNNEEPFRSALEFLMLMHSALTI